MAYPDTLVGHRLAHHDDQRPGRARLGRRRHRGRGGHARPAGVDADPQGRRLQAHRRGGARHHRDRPGAHGHRDAAQARRGRQVRRVLRRRRRRRAAGQPRHDRQHEPGVRLDLRDLPDRRGDAALPALHRPARGAGRARRGVRQGAGPLARPVAASRSTPRRSSSTWLPSCRRSPGRSARRTGCRCHGAKAGVPHRGCATTRAAVPAPGCRTAAPTRRAASRSRPATRPPRIADKNGDAQPRGGAQRRRGRRPAEQPGAGHARRAATVRARPRPRRHRRHHVAAPTRPTRQVMVGAALLAKNAVEQGPDPQAVGQDHAGARLEGRHGLLRQGGPHALPRQARLQPGRLRLHHLHRQLRPAARGDQRRGQRGRPRCGVACCPATATSRAGSTPT